MFGMYPAGRHLSNSKVSLGLLSDHTCSLLYSMELITVLQGRLGADYRADVCVFEFWNLDFRFKFSTYGFRL